MIWSNGELVETASVSALDHGFTVGDGVFETVKTLHGHAFALTRHLQRLRMSAAGMNLPEPEETLVRSAVDRLLAVEPFAVGRMRITWTAGVGGAGSQRATQIRPTLIITHNEGSTWPENAKVMTMAWPRNERSPLVHLKTTSYAENVLALDIAHRAGADEAIFFNHAGNLAEGTGSNVIARIGGIWKTPPIESGILAGVTRALAIEWLGIVESDISREEFMAADEVLLASTTRDLQAVNWMDGRDISGTRSSALKQLIANFAEHAAQRIDP